jgi:hypothetical protein
MEGIRSAQNILVGKSEETRSPGRQWWRWKGRHWIWRCGLDSSGLGERKWGILWTQYWTFGVHKRERISWVSEKLWAPQDGLCSVESSCSYEWDGCLISLLRWIGKDRKVSGYGMLNTYKLLFRQSHSKWTDVSDPITDIPADNKAGLANESLMRFLCADVLHDASLSVLL